MANIQFRKRLEKAPVDTVNVYGIRSAEVSEERVLRTAKAFSLKASLDAGNFRKSGLKMSYIEFPYVLEMYTNSGGFFFYDSDKYMKDDGESDLKLDARRLQSIAQNHIEKLGVFPAKDAKFVKVNYLVLGTGDREMRSAFTRTINAQVVYQQVVDVIPMDGPGGHSSVFIGQAGEVIGTKMAWRQPGRVLQEKAKVISPAEAEKKPADYFSYFNGTVTVMDERFDYFQLDPRDRQDILQPVYLMPVKLEAGQESAPAYEIYVTPAVAGMKELMPPYTKPLPQPPRVSDN